ncbi:Beta-1,3-galactosyl-O-glycosyl-glycoprotein beta-1,6-N-acetylglucosaminyltransferase 3 [Aphelenchoides bicaudatus]|nr:Beta-1,3-galactosyl-O-glycosyl-glycoprotein beta-1,6-N-acetylglucosaminyltransferase 3 [Aphelenchoides bicaudatus]
MLFRAKRLPNLFASLPVRSRLPKLFAGHLIRNRLPRLFTGFNVAVFVCLIIIVELFILGYRDSPIFTLKFHKKPVHFKRPNVTQHVPCHKFFQSQFEHGYLAKKFRINYTDPANEKDFPTDCASIFARNNFYMKPMSKEESEFPLAHARNVNKDYHFIEMLLSTTYAPQNLYCYSIDGKADKLFRKRMNDLAKCFPNIYITNFNATMDKLGHNTNAHHMSCLEWLNDKKKQWKYRRLEKRTCVRSVKLSAQFLCV